MILGRSKQNSGSAQAAEPETAVEVTTPNPDTDAAAQPALRPRDARQLRFAQSFAQAVTVMMRDPNFRKVPLAELEWLLLPPLMAGLFRFGHMPAQQVGEKEPGPLVSVAMALWAQVSPELDKMLSEDLHQPGRLPPDQWMSGDKIWLMAVAGDPRAIPDFMQRLAKHQFEGKEVKMRRLGADGKPEIATLGQSG